MKCALLASEDVPVWPDHPGGDAAHKGGTRHRRACASAIPAFSQDALGRRAALGAVRHWELHWDAYEQAQACCR